MRFRIGFRFVTFVLVLAACAPQPTDVTPDPPPSFDIRIYVVDEEGRPVSRAIFVAGESHHPADVDGEIDIVTNQPIAGVLTADGFIDEPLVVSRQTPNLAVRMFWRFGADGTPRTTLHFGGDVMLGRRYLEPLREDTARLRPSSIADDARAVVSELAPMFAAADVSIVNLESVVGDLPGEAAYPQKRFLLQTPPDALAALDELGVDVVALGNNHINDWQDLGLASTIRSLSAAGLAHTGAGANGTEARRPAVVDGYGSSVGVLSYTTVNGDFVNDSMPLTGDEPPAVISPDDEWLYTGKPFSWADADGAYVVRGDLLPGDAWRAWRAATPRLGGSDERSLWLALSGTFPELQDWVARRGHGGAAWFQREAVVEDIRSLRNQGIDLVVVQLHGGFQFSETGSEWLQEVAHASIDAGADIVIGHHPHVLQGFEWYDGKLIAYSLGNLVFDQDFLATYASTMLRVVYEGDRLIEAKVYPLSLEGYRPLPPADALAEDILRTIDARSATPAIARRLDDGSVGEVLVDPATRSSARMTIAGNVGYLGHATTSIDTVTVRVPALGSAPLDTTRLVKPRSDLSGIWFGRDIFGRGSFDDAFADNIVGAGSAWTWGDSGLLVARGDGYALELSTRPGNTSRVIARPVARITRSDHHFLDDQGEGVDGAAFYTIRLDVRRTTDVTPEIRITSYHFDDFNPVINPINDVIRTVVVPVDVPNDGEWHSTEIKLPVETFVPDGSRAANAAFFYLQVPPGRRVVGFDNVQFLEFRQADTLPSSLLQVVDAVRSTEGAQTVVLSLG